jgi:uncharacterized protein YbjT (DUF2867 family)
MRVLITGGSGYLGTALLRHIRVARPQWETHATFFSQPKLLKTRLLGVDEVLARVELFGRNGSTRV